MSGGGYDYYKKGGDHPASCACRTCIGSACPGCTFPDDPAIEHADWCKAWPKCWSEERRRTPRNTVDPHAGCNPTITERRTSPRMSIKQVIIVNGALTMSPGKLAAQVAHAAVGGAWDCNDRPDVLRSWTRQGVTKIVLRASNAEALGILAGLAEDGDLPSCLVVDEGRTEIPPGSVTCLAIGPADEDVINKITGNLPLYR